MRPQFTRHARRAVAAVGALALGTAVAATAANPAISTAQPRINRHRHRQRHRRHHPLVHLRARLLHPNVLVGHDVAAIGLIAPAVNRRVVALQAHTKSRWVTVAHTRTDHQGYFRERFWPRRLGRLALRVRAAGVPLARTTIIGRGTTVYHKVVASWYDLPGARTACGNVLEPGTLGVANKTLPCGTRVTLRLGSHTVTVPVIDRGPYVPGRDYDLTYATKQALGAGGVSTIWASE
jgi:peptidoglycan lytic transglycosylase